MSWGSCWPYSCLAPPLGQPARATPHQGINLRCCSFLYFIKFCIGHSDRAARGKSTVNVAKLLTASLKPKLHRRTVNVINSLVSLARGCLWCTLSRSKRAWHFLKTSQLTWKLNKGWCSSVNGTLLHCHSLRPLLFVLTSKRFSVKMACAGCKRCLLSCPFFLFFFFSLPSAVTAWRRSFCVIGDNARTHTGTRQERAVWKKEKRQWKRELISYFNCVSGCPIGLHYPSILRNLTCLLLETCEECLLFFLWL